MATLELTDFDGDDLEVQTYPTEGDACVLVHPKGGEPVNVYLSRDQVLSLYHALGDALVASGSPEATTVPETDLPDATADGYDWPALQHITPETILQEAQAAVYGDRESDYGHPREDFTRQAILWTGLLQHKLQDGAYIEAEDIARCMVAVKLARDVHTPKRDNRVDGAGYFLTLDRLETGK